MQIQQNYQCPNFNGKIIFEESLEMAKAFKQNKALVKLSESGYDVFGTVNTRKTEMYDYNYLENMPLYRLLISIRKEHSLIAKIKNALGLNPKTYLSYNHYTDKENCELISQRITPEFILKRFGIDLSSKS